METAEAILAIRSNWPDERYTMLREALTKAIAALEEVEAGRTATNSQSDAICPHFKVEKYLGSDGWIEVNKCIVAGKLTHI